MTIAFADFDMAYSDENGNSENFGAFVPDCTAPTCFIGSYAPITPVGQTGPFFVNTYYLQDDRQKELAGPVKVKGSN
jgi:hypothetical protein